MCIGFYCKIVNRIRWNVGSVQVLKFSIRYTKRIRSLMLIRPMFVFVKQKYSQYVHYTLTDSIYRKRERESERERNEVSECWESVGKHAANREKVTSMDTTALWALHALPILSLSLTHTWTHTHVQQTVNYVRQTRFDGCTCSTFTNVIWPRCWKSRRSQFKQADRGKEMKTKKNRAKIFVVESSANGAKKARKCNWEYQKSD